jgi:hypothetical protein
VVAQWASQAVPKTVTTSSVAVYTLDPALGLSGTISGADVI